MIPFSLALVAGQLSSSVFSLPLAVVPCAALPWLGCMARRIFRRRRPTRFWNRAECASACGMALSVGMALVTWVSTPPSSGCFLPAHGPSQKAWLEATVVGAPLRLSDGVRLDVEAAVRRRGGFEPICGALRLAIAAPAPELGPGDRIRFHAHLRRPRNFANPGRYDRVGALARHRIWATAWAQPTTVTLLESGPRSWRRWIAAERSRIGRVIDGSVPPADAALLRALVIGDSFGVPDELRDRIARAGVAHLLAVSGLHVGIVWGVGFSLFHWLGSRSERLLLRVNVRAAAGALAVPAAVLYAFLAGGRLPTGRAVLMTVLLTIAVGCGRELRPMRALILAAAVLSSYQPGSPLEVSFQLSVAAVAFLILGIDTWTRRAGAPQPPRDWWRERLALAVVVPAAAFLGTAPLTAWHFNRIAPIGILSNPVLVPFCGVPATLLGLAGAALSFASEGAAAAVFRLAGLVLAAFRTGVDVAVAIPLGSIRVPTPTCLEVALLYALLALPWYAAPWRRAIGVSLLSALLLDLGFAVHDRFFDPRLRLRFLDVGQGDSAVIELPGGRVLVVDGGGFARSSFDVGERVVARYLLARRILRIDALVVSHSDWDHQGGLHALAREFSPRELWRSDRSEEGMRLERLERLVKRSGGRVRKLGAGETVYADQGVTIECLHPPPTGILSWNDASLVLRLALGSFSVLLSGDIESSGERLLLGRGPDAVTVLKVPHHGSRTSSTPGLLAVLRPRLAVFSVGAGNRYGFPHPEVLARYEELGEESLRTDIDGSVSVWSDGGRMSVRPFARASPLFCPGVGALC